MKEADENYFLNLGNNLKNNDKLMELYISSLKEVNLYLNNFTFENYPYPENCIISTNLLTKRQVILSDMIFEYIATDILGNLPEIYHELHDFIYDYGNKDDNISYIEFILLKKNNKCTVV